MIIGSDRGGLGIGLRLGIRIADLNQIADRNLTPCLVFGATPVIVERYNGKCG